MTSESSEQPAARFPTTMWTVLMEARENKSSEALETLFSAYWRPVYSVLRLGCNQSHENAKDLTQGFFMSLMEHSFAEKVDPRKGRFRNYLKGALKRFMLNQKRDAGRLKRGGHLKFASFEALSLEPASPNMSPVALFDQMWAKNMLRRAIQAAEQTVGKKDRDFWIEALRLRDLDSSEMGPPTYEQLGSELGKTPAEIKKGLEGARRILRLAILKEIRRYAVKEAEVREELEELFSAV